MYWWKFSPWSWKRSSHWWKFWLYLIRQYSRNVMEDCSCIIQKLFKSKLHNSWLTGLIYSSFQIFPVQTLSQISEKLATLLQNCPKAEQECSLSPKRAGVLSRMCSHLMHSALKTPWRKPLCKYIFWGQKCDWSRVPHIKRRMQVQK